MQWYHTDCDIVCRVCNDITLIVTYVRYAMISHCLWHRMSSMQWYRTDCDIICQVCNDIALTVTSQSVLSGILSMFISYVIVKLNWYCQLCNCHIHVKILSVNSCIKCNYFSINVYKKSYKRWTVSWCNFAWHSVTGNIRVV